MIEKREYNGLTWVDASSPTPEEVRALVLEHKLHPTAGEELLLHTTRPKVTFYGDHIYLVLHFPTAGSKTRTSTSQEIDFIIGKNLLLTTHYDPIEHLRKFGKAFEMSAILGHNESDAHAGHLFAHLLKSLYEGMARELENIESQLIAIEKSIFEGNEREMVSKLSLAGRELLAFAQTTRLHQSTLESLETAGTRLYGEDFLPSLQGMSGAHSRTQEAMRSNQELLEELRSTNDSLLSAKQNEVIRTLTAVSFAILPLALIAAIFTMDVPNKPFATSPNGFLSVVILMLITLGSILGYFKVKKWF